MKKKKNKYKISPKEYSEYIKGVEIEQIKYESGSFKIQNEDILNENSSVKIKYKRNAELVEVLENSFTVKDKLSFSVIEKTSRKHIIDIKCSIIVNYKHPNGINEEIFEVFKNYNVPVNTWPYFREFVSSSITRMGLPPFTLPAWHTVK